MGREKVMRTLQYWSRFFAFYLYRAGYSKETVAFWKNLQTQLATSRKLFRVGKPLTHAKLGVSAYANKNEDLILRLATIGRQIGYFGYMTLDTVMWIHSARLKQFTPERFGSIQKIAYRFWFFGLASGIVNSLRKYHKAHASEIALRTEGEKDEESSKRVQAEKCAATKQLVWDGLDICIPLSALKIVEFDDGFVGLCGLITSLMGLKQVW